MKKTPKIIVLGSTGMLGSTVFAYLSKKYPNTTYATSRNKPKKNIFKFDANKPASIELILEQFEKVDFIINCIAEIRPNANHKINYTLPNHFEKIENKFGFKFIHISTDDVFPQLSSKVNEKNIPKPTSKYGKSKLRGETKLNQSITIRTSILGFDPINKKGAIEWVIKNKSKKINGFTNQLWNGCTTLQFAQLCEALMIDNNFDNLREKTNIIHFTPLGPVSKYEMVKAISNELKLNTKIYPEKSNTTITRELDSIYFDKEIASRYTTQIDLAIKHLLKFQKSI